MIRIGAEKQAAQAISLPSSWEDCTLDQIKVIVPILLADDDPDSSDPHLEKRMLMINTMVKFDLWERLKDMTEDMDHWAITVQAILKEFNFMYDQDGALAYNMTRCPFPEIKIHSDDLQAVDPPSPDTGRRDRREPKDKDKDRSRRTAGGGSITLLAPADGLSNLSFYELGQVFTLFEQVLEDPVRADSDQFLKLLSIIYRPRKRRTVYNIRQGYRGDLRQPLLHHESMIQRREPLIMTLPYQVVQTLYYWIGSCYMTIARAWPNIFGTPGSGSGSSSGDDQNDYGWSGVLMHLSDGLIHIDKVGSQPYQNVFVRLSMLEDQRQLQVLKQAANGTS